MALGRRSRALTARQIERFKEMQYRFHRTMPEMKLVMDAPFGWRTLQRAIDGNPVMEMSHKFITDWLEKFAPETLSSVVAPDGKSLSTGERVRTDER
jgi:hypothetical protein